MAHTHHDDYGTSQGFAAASWMMAMLGVIIAIVLGVAFLVWAPWNDSSGTTTNNNTEQEAPADGNSSEGSNDGGVNIEGNNVDIGDAPEVPDVPAVPAVPGE